MPTTLKEFEAVFPTLVEDLLAHCKQYGLPTQALTWFEKVSGTFITSASFEVYMQYRLTQIAEPQSQHHGRKM